VPYGASDDLAVGYSEWNAAMTNPLGQRLRRDLTPGAAAITPGAANAIAARLIEAAGFPALEVTGAGVTNSYLGFPDVGLITLTELASNVAAMRDAVEIPLLVDADTGFGNAVNVRRTVRVLERAGGNLIQIEDQVFPKKCGHFEGKQVISRDEMVQKIKAAVDARHDEDTLILARTDARAIEGLDAALERMAAYREAGADIMFVEAPASVEELAQIPKALPGPHFCNMVIGGKTPLLPRQELQRLGYAGVFYANIALQASLLAMQKVLGHLSHEGTIAGIENMIMPFADRQKIVDLDFFSRLEKRYAHDERSQSGNSQGSSS
jgi:2-methylisocitrate lyase-like PEP mutase family enzyme